VGIDICNKCADTKKRGQKISMREKLANLCHEQWSGWMSYLFSKGTFNKNGTWTMPKEFVSRWKGQIATSYKNLSHSEQESDRTEADKFLAVFNNLSAKLPTEEEDS